MNRYLLVAALVMGGSVVALLLWINSEVSDQYDERQELMETGKISRQRSDIPEGQRTRVRNPRRKAKEVLLSIRLPDEDPRAAIGGPFLMMVRGNQVLYRRPAPARPAYRRSILKSRPLDDLLARASALEAKAAAPATPHRVEILGEDAVSIRYAGDDDLEALLKIHGDGERDFEPEAALLHLRRVEAPPAEATRHPWPLRRTSPTDFVAAPARLEARSQILARLVKAAQEEQTLEAGPDDAREHFRVVSIALELR